MIPDEKDLREKIQELEKELQQYQQEKQKEIDKFMFESGMTAFINDFQVNISRMQSKIDTLKEFLPIKEKEEDGEGQ